METVPPPYSGDNGDDDFSTDADFDAAMKRKLLAARGLTVDAPIEIPKSRAALIRLRHRE